MTVKERLKDFIKVEKITVKAFEESLEMSNGYVNSISKGIGDAYMRKLIEKYPNLNIKWLLTGEGEMLNSGEDVEDVLDEGNAKNERQSDNNGS